MFVQVALFGGRGVGLELELLVRAGRVGWGVGGLVRRVGSLEAEVLERGEGVAEGGGRVDRWELGSAGRLERWKGGSDR